MASSQWQNMQVSVSSEETHFSARIGQCFSTTRPVVDVEVIEIPDIEYNGYCFTDGVTAVCCVCSSQVGKISQNLAELVTNAIGYDPVSQFGAFHLTSSSLLMCQAHSNFDSVATRVS